MSINVLQKREESYILTINGEKQPYFLEKTKGYGQWKKREKNGPR